MATRQTKINREGRAPQPQIQPRRRRRRTRRRSGRR